MQSRVDENSEKMAKLHEKLLYQTTGYYLKKPFQLVYNRVSQIVGNAPEGTTARTAVDQLNQHYRATNRRIQLKGS